MADSTRFLEVALTSGGMPLLSTLQSAAHVFKNVQVEGDNVAFSGKQAGLFYCENVLPTNGGLTSVAPLTFASNILAGDLNNRITYEDAAQVFVFSTNDGSLYKSILIFKYFLTLDNNYEVRLYTYNPDASDGFFQNELTPITLPALADFTKAADLAPRLEITKFDLAGRSYLCLSVSYKAAVGDMQESERLTKVLKVLSNTVAPTTFEDITASMDLNWDNTVSGDYNDVVKGMFSSKQYLVAYTENRIAWSSPTNSFDFTPSTITGAGSGVPAGVTGFIVTCVDTPSGFSIYYTGGLLQAKFTNNPSFPWSFQALSNTAGVQSANHVTTSSPQYAVTTSGVAISDGNSVDVALPEVADFLAANIYEYYDIATQTVIAENHFDPLEFSLSYIADRYLVLSYKAKDMEYYEYALVYDVLLNSLGKIRVSHKVIFQLNIDVLGELFDYYYLDQSETTVTYEQLDEISYTLLRKSSTKQGASVKYVIGVVNIDGTLQVIDPSLTETSAAGVAIFGKFSIKEHLATTIDYVTFENIVPESDFTCSIQTSYTGTGVDVIEAPTKLDAGGTYVKYGTRITGRWHTVIAKGAFNLTRMSVAIRSAGYR